MLFTVISFSQTTYYMDATGGSDSNDGLSTGTAWRTLTKLSEEASGFNPGDKILFKRGEEWYGERIKVLNHPSGTSDNPITYGAYGTGNKPVLDVNHKQYPTWTNEGGNIWSAVIGASSRFFKNGVEMLRDPLPGDIPLGTQGTEYYTELINDGNNFKLYVYSTTDPVNDVYRWANHDVLFYIPEASYIKISDLNLVGGSSATVMLENNSYIDIENCNIGLNSGYGLVTKYSSHIKVLQSDFDSNFTVDQSTLEPGGSGVDDTGCNDAVFVGRGTEYIEIANCYFKNWSHASFTSNTTHSDAKIRYVSFHDNELTAPDIIYGGRIGYSGYSEDGEYYNNNLYNIKVAN